MPVNTTYEGYDLVVEKVTRVRDFAGGEFKVKPKKETYLPMLGGQTKLDYDAYLTRGFIIPAVEPTATAICGAIMRKPAVFEPVGTVAYLETDIDGNNTNVNTFVSNMVKELQYAGAVGYLVEFDDVAVVKTYVKESIVNVSDDYIILSQEYTVQSDKDKFIQETKTEYLELTTDESGFYIQNIWRETKSGWVIFDVKMPDNRGERLTEIPFVLSSPNGKSLIDSDPILLHLSNVNLDQYRMSTDHRHGLHWTALPTMFLFGELKDANGNNTQITIGAGSSNHIADDEARVELLEFTGAGLGALKAAIDDNVLTMASIGAKMLMGGNSGVKAAETARIEASSETATLATIANTVDLTMAQLIDIVSTWMGVEPAEYAVNRDFIDTKLDFQQLLAYHQIFMSGGMSLDTFLNLLFKGELLPKGVTPEDEADRIETTGTNFGDEFNEET